MSKIKWDLTGERIFETGVDHAVLYIPDNTGAYATGVPWNGIKNISEQPSGAEPNKQYADNMVYFNLVSAEDYKLKLEAYTYPEEFMQFDGVASPQPGVSIGQQSRGVFGLAYRTLIGNDLVGQDAGYKLHLVYGAQSSPSEKSYDTINESPEATTFSYDLSTTPVVVGTVGGVAYKPAASLTINSTKVNAAKLAAFEAILYGTDGSPGTTARLPLPAEVIGLFAP